ncbi:hypothetical protein [Bacterioplanoides sp.]|uniref:hypothetical protein n=1 Tax=Bacterioplanoides sp. TaxID=2066072 RepID=UPI003B5C3E7B
MADEELEMQDSVHEESEEQKDEMQASDSDDAESTAEKDAHEDLVVSTSSAARDEMRQSMEDDVAAFLARGGQITQVDDNVMADPPRKPQTNYGSRPI